MLATKEIVLLAVEIARPSVEAILNTPGATWGPRWVEVPIKVPGVILTWQRFGQITPWDDLWGPQKDFEVIATRKLNVVIREKQPTSVIALTKPWLLEDGEFLYSGGAYQDGIAVACSGAKGWADEAISWIIIAIIQMLVRLKADLLRTSNDPADHQIFSRCFLCDGTGLEAGSGNHCTKCNGTGRGYGFTDAQLKEMSGPKPL